MPCYCWPVGAGCCCILQITFVRCLERACRYVTIGVWAFWWPRFPVFGVAVVTDSPHVCWFVTDCTVPRSCLIACCTICCTRCYGFTVVDYRYVVAADVAVTTRVLRWLLRYVRTFVVCTFPVHSFVTIYVGYVVPYVLACSLRFHSLFAVGYVPFFGWLGCSRCRSLPPFVGICCSTLLLRCLFVRCRCRCCCVVVDYPCRYVSRLITLFFTVVRYVYVRYVVLFAVVYVPVVPRCLRLRVAYIALWILLRFYCRVLEQVTRRFCCTLNWFVTGAPLLCRPLFGTFWCPLTLEPWCCSHYPHSPRWCIVVTLLIVITFVIPLLRWLHCLDVPLFVHCYCSLPITFCVTFAFTLFLLLLLCLGLLFVDVTGLLYLLPFGYRCLVAVGSSFVLPHYWVLTFCDSLRCWFTITFVACCVLHFHPCYYLFLIPVLHLHCFRCFVLVCTPLLPFYVCSYRVLIFHTTPISFFSLLLIRWLHSFPCWLFRDCPFVVDRLLFLLTGSLMLLLFLIGEPFLRYVVVHLRRLRYRCTRLPRYAFYVVRPRSTVCYVLLFGDCCYVVLPLRWTCALPDRFPPTPLFVPHSVTIVICWVVVVSLERLRCSFLRTLHCWPHCSTLHSTVDLFTVIVLRILFVDCDFTFVTHLLFLRLPITHSFCYIPYRTVCGLFVYCSPLFPAIHFVVHCWNCCYVTFVVCCCICVVPSVLPFVCSLFVDVLLLLLFYVVIVLRFITLLLRHLLLTFRLLFVLDVPIYLVLLTPHLFDYIPLMLLLLLLTLLMLVFVVVCCCWWLYCCWLHCSLYVTVHIYYILLHHTTTPRFCCYTIVCYYVYILVVVTFVLLRCCCILRCFVVRYFTVVLLFLLRYICCCYIVVDDIVIPVCSVVVRCVGTGIDVVYPIPIYSYRAVPTLLRSLLCGIHCCCSLFHLLVTRSRLDWAAVGFTFCCCSLLLLSYSTLLVYCSFIRIRLLFWCYSCWLPTPLWYSLLFIWYCDIYVTLIPFVVHSLLVVVVRCFLRSVVVVVFVVVDLFVVVLLLFILICCWCWYCSTVVRYDCCLRWRYFTTGVIRCCCYCCVTLFVVGYVVVTLRVHFLALRCSVVVICDPSVLRSLLVFVTFTLFVLLVPCLLHFVLIVILRRDYIYCYCSTSYSDRFHCCYCIPVFVVVIPVCYCWLLFIVVIVVLHCYCSTIVYIYYCCIVVVSLFLVVLLLCCWYSGVLLLLSSLLLLLLFIVNCCILFHCYSLLLFFVVVVCCSFSVAIHSLHCCSCCCYLLLVRLYTHYIIVHSHSHVVVVVVTLPRCCCVGLLLYYHFVVRFVSCCSLRCLFLPLFGICCWPYVLYIDLHCICCSFVLLLLLLFCYVWLFVVVHFICTIFLHVYRLPLYVVVVRRLLRFVRLLRFLVVVAVLLFIQRCLLTVSVRSWLLLLLRLLPVTLLFTIWFTTIAFVPVRRLFDVLLVPLRFYPFVVLYVVHLLPRYVTTRLLRLPFVCPLLRVCVVVTFSHGTFCCVRCCVPRLRFPFCWVLLLLPLLFVVLVRVVRAVRTHTQRLYFAVSTVIYFVVVTFCLLLYHVYGCSLLELVGADCSTLLASIRWLFVPAFCCSHTLFVRCSFIRSCVAFVVDFVTFGALRCTPPFVVRLHVVRWVCVGWLVDCCVCVMFVTVDVVTVCCCAVAFVVRCSIRCYSSGCVLERWWVLFDALLLRYICYVTFVRYVRYVRSVVRFVTLFVVVCSFRWLYVVRSFLVVGSNIRWLFTAFVTLFRSCSFVTFHVCCSSIPVCTRSRVALFCYRSVCCSFVSVCLLRVAVVGCCVHSGCVRYVLRYVRLVRVRLRYVHSRCCSCRSVSVVDGRCSLLRSVCCRLFHVGRYSSFVDVTVCSFVCCSLLLRFVRLLRYVGLFICSRCCWLLITHLFGCRFLRLIRFFVPRCSLRFRFVCWTFRYLCVRSWYVPYVVPTLPVVLVTFHVLTHSFVPMISLLVRSFCLLFGDDWWLLLFLRFVLLWLFYSLLHFLLLHHLFVHCTYDFGCGGLLPRRFVHVYYPFTTVVILQRSSPLPVGYVCHHCTLVTVALLHLLICLLYVTFLPLRLRLRCVSRVDCRYVDLRTCWVALLFAGTLFLPLRLPCVCRYVPVPHYVPVTTFTFWLPHCSCIFFPLLITLYVCQLILCQIYLAPPRSVCCLRCVHYVGCRSFTLITFDFVRCYVLRYAFVDCVVAFGGYVYGTFFVAAFTLFYVRSRWFTFIATFPFDFIRIVVTVRGYVPLDYPILFRRPISLPHVVGYSHSELLLQRCCFFCGTFLLRSLVLRLFVELLLVVAFWSCSCILVWLHWFQTFCCSWFGACVVAFHLLL